MSAAELAARMAAVKYLKDVIATEEVRVKAALEAELEPGDRKMATLEGAEIGTITRAKLGTKERVVVTSEPALLAWCKANGQEDAIVTRLADWFTAEANLAALIAKTGELPDGVDIETRESGGYISVRQSDTQKDNLTALAATGAIAGLVADLAQIEGHHD